MRIFSAIVLLVFSLAALGDTPPPPGDTRASEAAKKGLARRGEYAPAMTRPTYDRERIQKLSDQAHARGKAELERLKARAHGATGTTEKAANDAGTGAVTGRVVVALSSSMPDPMLSSYLQQLDGRRESLVVLRGFVGGASKVKPTGKFIERFRRKSAGNPQGAHYAVETVVDPMLYQQLGIDQVPAVAWLGGVQDLSHCNDEDYSKAVVIYGAASVEAALREARKAGASVPDAVLARYTATGWEHR